MNPQQYLNNYAGMFGNRFQGGPVRPVASPMQPSLPPTMQGGPVQPFSPVGAPVPYQPVGGPAPVQGGPMPPVQSPNLNAYAMLRNRGVTDPRMMSTL